MHTKAAARQGGAAVTVNTAAAQQHVHFRLAATNKRIDSPLHCKQALSQQHCSIIKPPAHQLLLLLRHQQPPAGALQALLLLLLALLLALLLLVLQRLLVLLTA
jgi:hypothetical protein